MGKRKQWLKGLLHSLDLYADLDQSARHVVKLYEFYSSCNRVTRPVHTSFYPQHMEVFILQIFQYYKSLKNVNAEFVHQQCFYMELKVHFKSITDFIWSF